MNHYLYFICLYYFQSISHLTYAFSMIIFKEELYLCYIIDIYQLLKHFSLYYNQLVCELASIMLVQRFHNCYIIDKKICIYINLECDM